jgi:hypothetical protein
VVTPVVTLIKIHRWLTRWSARHAPAPWLADLTDGIAGLIATPVAYVVTVFYSTCYPRHFYHNASAIVGRRPSAGSKPFPYLLRPFPYWLAFVGLMNLLKQTGVPWLSRLPDASVWEYNFGLVVMTLAVLPALAILATVVLIFTAGLLRILSGVLGMAQRMPINWAFFSLVRRPRFWKQYHYSELFPAMLYCTINAIILLPLALYIFMGIVSTAQWYVETASTSYGLGLILLAVTVSAATVLYGLVVRPILCAFVFRSDISLLRRGVFPEFFTVGRSILTGNYRTVFLNADWEESPPDQAVFIGLSGVGVDGRMFNKILPSGEAARLEKR